jgi:outer membrane immunogenic protein
MSHFALRAAAAGVFLMAGALGASAADLNHSTMAPASPSPLVNYAFNWSGAYVGGNIGANWVNISLPPIATAGHNGSTAAITGGLQAGYLWQTGQIVYGLETFLNFDGNSKTFSYINGYNGNTYSEREREDLDFGVRGRLGYAIDRFLPYVSAGVTFADLNSRLYNATANLYDSKTTLRTGYQFGGGLEYAITNNWTARGEYTFSDYGHYKVGYGQNGQAYGHDVTDNALRFSINYKF